MAAPSLAERWDALAEALRGYRDVLDARVLDGRCPAALERRGWAAPLLALSDEALITLEIEGVEAEAPASLPGSLVGLFTLARELTQLPLLCAEEPPARRLRRLETPRKRTQVQALAELARPLLVDARRVVEVGAGHGHLAREVAAQVERPVVGLERDPALSRKAQQLESFDRLSFVEGDALLGELPLGPGDCALGLHACGELGDALVEGVAAKADALLLVGCCLQKRRAPARAPLNAGRPLSSEMVVSKELLGLSNFTPRSEGVEASRAENVAARERRLALHALLSERVGPLRFGAEMDGLNRRAAHGSLDAMARRACSRCSCSSIARCSSTWLASIPVWGWPSPGRSARETWCWSPVADQVAPCSSPVPPPDVQTYLTMAMLPAWADRVSANGCDCFSANGCDSFAACDAYPICRTCIPWVAFDDANCWPASTPRRGPRSRAGDA